MLNFKIILSLKFAHNDVKLWLLENRQVKDISLGSEHTICLADDNTLWAWGWNEHANTGASSDDSVFIPTRVPLDTNSKITQIYAGGAHNFLVTDNVEDTQRVDACEN